MPKKKHPVDKYSIMGEVYEAFTRSFRRTVTTQFEDSTVDAMFGPVVDFGNGILEITLSRPESKEFHKIIRVYRDQSIEVAIDGTSSHQGARLLRPSEALLPTSSVDMDVEGE